MFKARDAKAWQREFPVEFPVRVCASNLLSINIFLDIVARKESRCVIKAKHVLLVCKFVRFFAGKTNELTDQQPMFFYKISLCDKGCRPVASFIKEVNRRLAKRPLKTNGRLANLE